MCQGRYKLIFGITILFLLPGCKNNLWNSPHQDITKKNIIFSSFSAPPKTLDPAQAYSADSYTFISQIYEPPLQYHYLKRPYQLIPLAAAAMPKITYLDNNGNAVTNPETTNILQTTYTISIKPKQYYQLHPAFAKNSTGNYRDKRKNK